MYTKGEFKDICSYEENVEKKAEKHAIHHPGSG